MRAWRTCVPEELACPSFVLIAVLLFWALPARSEELVADLTSHLIAITTGFTGASVVLFGATDGPGDVVVAVRGPSQEMTVRRKNRVAGIWVNTQEVTFVNVPSFYAVAASRPIEEILLPATAAFYRLGVTNLKLEPEAPTPSVVVDAFRADSIARNSGRGCLWVIWARWISSASACSARPSHFPLMCRPGPIS